MSRITRFFALFLPALLLALSAFAQNSASAPDMASGLRQNGKIYVVVIVLGTIFAGIIAFLIYLDRKVARIEREAKSKSAFAGHQAAH